MTGPHTDPAVALAAAGRHLAVLGLSPGTFGNLSLRTPDGILATPTGGSLAALEANQLSVLDGHGRLRTGPPPDKEVPLHLAVHDRLAGASAVTHLHSTYAVALACTEPDDPDDALIATARRPALRQPRARSTARPAMAAVPETAGPDSYWLRHWHRAKPVESGDVPRVVVEARTGRGLPGVEGLYSEMTVAMEERIVEYLQRVWEREVVSAGLWTPHFSMPLPGDSHDAAPSLFSGLPVLEYE